MTADPLGGRLGLALKMAAASINVHPSTGTFLATALDGKSSVGYSGDSPFGLSLEELPLVTISFSDPDRMDNLLKPHI